MSRQHGKRRPPARSSRSRAAPAPRPAPAREAAETAETADAASPAPGRARLWVAVGVASVLALVIAWALLVALAAAVDRADGADVETAAITAPLTVGLVLVPVSFAALAFISRHPRPAGAVLRATLLAPIAVVVLFVARDPVAAGVAGLGAGGIVALRPGPAGLRPRIWAVAIMTIYTAVLAYALGAASLSVLPLVFPALVLADGVGARRLERLREAAESRRA